MTDVFARQVLLYVNFKIRKKGRAVYYRYVNMNHMNTAEDAR
jgi:hypothetical protein